MIAVSSAISFKPSCQSEWARLLWRFILGGDYINLFELRLVSEISPKGLQDSYEKYGNAVFRLAITLLKNHAAAEDLVHDVFIRFWSSNKYDERRGTKLNYLLTLTKSMAINQINKSSNRKRIIEKWTSVFNPQRISLEEEMQIIETSIEVQLALR